MASYSEGCGRLTGYQYSLLGLCISCTNMEVIALEYMGIDMEKLKNLKEARREDKEGFVRDVIETWAYRHPDNQIQVRIVDHLRCKKNVLSILLLFSCVCEIQISIEIW